MSTLITILAVGARSGWTSRSESRGQSCANWIIIDRKPIIGGIFVNRRGESKQNHAQAILYLLGLSEPCLWRFYRSRKRSPFRTFLLGSIRLCATRSTYCAITLRATRRADKCERGVSSSSILTVSARRQPSDFKGRIIPPTQKKKQCAAVAPGCARHADPADGQCVFSTSDEVIGAGRAPAHTAPVDRRGA